MTAQLVELQLPRGLLYESARWSDLQSSFSWVDVDVGTLYVWDVRNATIDSRHLGAPLGCALPLGSGRFVVAGERSVSVYDWNADVTTPFVELPVPGGHRLNDGALGRDGSLWIGSMSEDGEPVGFLWRVDADGSVTTVRSGVAISNGIGWLADGRMLHVDSPTRAIDLVDSRSPESAESFFELSGPGVPDGLCVDAEGSVWVAIWGRGEVVRLNAAGHCTGVVAVDGPLVTSVAIGGLEGDTILVTTAARGMTPEELAAYPASGRVLVGRRTEAVAVGESPESMSRKAGR